MDYGYLGVESLTIWPQLADRLDLDVDTGALVQGVVDGSPAEGAGIEAGDDQITFQGQDEIATGGDLIVGVNGEELTREHDLADEISDHSAGDRVRLTLLRDGERRTIEVELGRRPARSLDAGCRVVRCFRVGCLSVVDVPPVTDSRDVSLTIPARPDYLVLARLALSAVCRPDAALARGGGGPEARDHRGGERLRGRDARHRRREPAQLLVPPW